MFTGITAILGVLAPILSKILPDADAVEQAKLQIQEALIQNQSAIYQSMGQVMAADAQSESWLTRNLRPIAGFSSLGMIWLTLLSAPFGYSQVFIQAFQSIPSDMWNLTMVSIGGYILARGMEKTAANYAGKNG